MNKNDLYRLLHLVILEGLWQPVESLVHSISREGAASLKPTVEVRVVEWECKIIRLGLGGEHLWTDDMIILTINYINTIYACFLQACLFIVLHKSLSIVLYCKVMWMLIEQHAEIKNCTGDTHITLLCVGDSGSFTPIFKEKYGIKIFAKVAPTCAYQRRYRRGFPDGLLRLSFSIMKLALTASGRSCVRGDKRGQEATLGSIVYGTFLCRLMMTLFVVWNKAWEDQVRRNAQWKTCLEIEQKK